MPTLKFIELDGDLFSSDEQYALAHCVAADMKMGKGIAVRFRDKFGQVAELKKQNARPGGLAFLKKERFVYYLVTKESSWGKPTYQSLDGSLRAMRTNMVENNVAKLAMPRIGCGLDGLQWNKVKDLILSIFGNDNFEIVIYNYKPPEK